MMFRPRKKKSEYKSKYKKVLKLLTEVYLISTKSVQFIMSLFEPKIEAALGSMFNFSCKMSSGKTYLHQVMICSKETESDSSSTPHIIYETCSSSSVSSLNHHSVVS